MTDKRDNHGRPPRRPGGDDPARGKRFSAGGDRPLRRGPPRDGAAPPSGGSKAKRDDAPRGPKRDFGKPRPDRKPRAAAPPAPVEARPDGPQRIAKIIARAGLCSRRDAELWVNEGRVAVNGVTLTSPAFNVNPGDAVLVDGKPLAQRERTRLFLFHKPRGYVTTDRDPEGRPTVFDAMPQGLPRLVTVGRLDINTEGLLLLTNDGGLARLLELPATGWLRRYRVRAKGETDQGRLDALRAGVTVEGIDYLGIEANLDRQQGANVWMTIGLREGKNREVKRVLEHIGLEVNRLIRVSFGPFQLGELDDGAVEEVPTRILRDQLGPALAVEAGVDLDGPVAPREPRREADAPARAPRGASDRGPRRERSDDRPPRPRSGFGGRDDRRGQETEEVRPRVDRPKAGPRKHISVLRAERRAEAAGPRQRIERAATADRQGRTVAVERVVSTAPDAKVRGGRNARRFAKEREGQAGPRPERAYQPRGKRFGERAGAPEREDFRGPKPERKTSKFAGARAESGGRQALDRSFAKEGDRGPRGPRPDRGDRAERSGERSFRPRPEGDARGPRPEGGRPGGRSFKPRGDRDGAARPEGGERPRFEGRGPKREGSGGGRSGPPRGEGRGPRREGGERPRFEGRGPKREGQGGDRNARGPRPEGRGPRGPRPPGGGPKGRGPRRDA